MAKRKIKVMNKDKPAAKDAPAKKDSEGKSGTALHDHPRSKGM